MTLKTRFSVFFVLLVFVSIGAYSLKAPSFITKLTPSVQKFISASRDTNQSFPVFVVLKEQADLTQADNFRTKLEKGTYVYNQLRTTALKSQGNLVAWLKGQNVSFRQYYITNMISINGATRPLIEALASRSDVAKVVGNPAIAQEVLPIQMDVLADSNTAVENSITSTEAPRVWNELHVTGSGIVVAGQDTGVQWDHPALKAHYRGYSANAVNHAYSWHDSIHEAVTPGETNPCGFDTKAPCDDDQHGTHTMGTMVGDDGALNKIGMAPGAKWMACRNMDRGTGRPTSYIECFEFFLAPYPQGGNPMTDGVPAYAPHVINNSWGCPASEGCEGSEMIPVLQAMYKAGILVVASAGNDGPGCSTIQDQPAQLTGLTLSVGAHNHRDGSIADFSSRGPSRLDGGVGPDITAPGVSIRSSVPGSSYAGGWSGTSMAGPHVVGLVALIWSAHPELIGNIAKTVSIIKSTATPTTSTETCGGISGGQIPNNTFGYGRINAYKAVTFN